MQEGTLPRRLESQEFNPWSVLPLFHSGCAEAVRPKAASIKDQHPPTHHE